MDDERINEALRDATDAGNVTTGTRVLASVDEAFGQCFGDATPVVVTDGNEWEEAQRNLEAAGRETVELYVFPGRPTLAADYRNVELLAPWRQRRRTNSAHSGPRPSTPTTRRPSTWTT
jgi:glycerol-1-phosphate dehydrogenase [NAD(P)+]